MINFFSLLLLFISLSIPSFAQNKLSIAKDLEVKGDFAKAYQSLESYINSNNKNLKSDVYLLKFRLLHRLGYDALNKKTPYQSYYSDAVQALLEAQKVAMNSTEKDFIKQENEQNFKRWLEMGINQYNIGDFQNALFWFQICEQLQTHNQDVINLIIYSLAELQKPELVIKRVSNYADFGFKNLEIFTIGLQASVETIQFEQALVWSDFVETHSDSVSIPILIHYDSKAANYWINKQLPQKSLYHLQRLIRFTDDEWFKITMAKVYADLGKTDEAIYQLKSVFLPEIQEAKVLDYYHTIWMQINPKANEISPVSAWKITSSLQWMKPYLLGKTLAKYGKLKQAQLLIQQSVDENPNYVPAIVLLAQTKYKDALNESDDIKMSEKLIATLPFYERAYKLQSDYPGLSETLKILYESMGDSVNVARFK